MQDNADKRYLPGFWCGVARSCVQGAPYGLQLGLGWEVICVSLFLSDSSHSDFIPGPPLPLDLVSMWKVLILCFHCLVSVPVAGGWLPLTGLSWIPYAFGSVLLAASPFFSRHHSPSLSIVDEFKVQNH